MKEYLVVVIMGLIASTRALMPQRRTEIAKPKDDSIDYRLPTSVVPSHYLLILEPNFDAISFTGYVEIDVIVTEKTDNITLHGLQFDYISVIVSNGDEYVDIKSQKNDNTREFRIIYLNETISEGEYQIKINYTGLWNNDLKGFYKSSYINSAGEER